MEQIIAQLLQKFEEGGISRRQLVQTLAAVATGASVGSTPAAAAAVPGLKVTGVHHISYQSADYRKTRDFYVNLFGMKVTDDTGERCNLSLGNLVIIPRTRPGVTPLIDHIAYSIDNWNQDAVLAALERRGLKLSHDHEDLTPGNDKVHKDISIKDPDGYRVQLSPKGVYEEHPERGRGK